LRESKAVGPMS